MQLMKFVATEICSSLRVEVTAYIFEYDESHDIFYPRIITPELNRLFMT